MAWLRGLSSTVERTRSAATAAGATFEGPLEEHSDAVFYLRGPNSAALLELVRTELLSDHPESAYAFIGAPGLPVSSTQGTVWLGSARLREKVFPTVTSAAGGP